MNIRRLQALTAQQADWKQPPVTKAIGYVERVHAIEWLLKTGVELPKAIGTPAAITDPVNQPDMVIGCDPVALVKSI